MDPEHRISVNFATPRELRIIPGIGDKLAEAIVEVRLWQGNVTASTTEITLAMYSYIPTNACRLETRCIYHSMKQ